MSNDYTHNPHSLQVDIRSYVVAQVDKTTRHVTVIFSISDHSQYATTLVSLLKSNFEFIVGSTLGSLCHFKSCELEAVRHQVPLAGTMHWVIMR